MPNRIEALLDAEAENQAEIDAYAEERESPYRDLFASLLVEVDFRDPEVFALFDVPVEIVLADYTDVPVPDRGAEWHVSLGAMWAAAKWQAWVELFGTDFLAFAKANGQKIRALASRMPRGDLKAAAVQGVGKDRMQAKADARRLRNDKS